MTEIKKVIIYRLFVAIPTSLVLNYIYYRNFYSSIEYTIVINILCTITHFLFNKLYI